MKDIAQPVMYQPSEEYRAWAQSRLSEQYAQLIKTLGIDTK